MATWIRDPNPVVVEIAKQKSHPSEEDEIIIINEGFSKPEDDEIKIHDEVFKVSGVMRVDQDGNIFAGRGTRDQKDPSYKFIRYNLNIPNEDRSTLQPKCILLESQFLKHHFIHWHLSSNVMCKPIQISSGDGPPPIDIKSPADQQFVWTIPTENSNQFALQTYDKPYFLVFIGTDSRASLREGDPARNSRFRLENLS